MKRMRLTGSVLTATASLLFASAATAAPITFFGENLSPGGSVTGDPLTARNDFLDNLAGVGTEDFEDESVGNISSLALNFPGSSGSITATLTGGGPASVEDSPGAGRFATSGTQYLETDGGAAFNIAFSDPVSAFGFYGTDIGDFGGEILLTLTNGVTENLNVGNTVNAPDSSLLFFGFIDEVNSFTNIAFDNTSGSDYFGFDDMTIGDPGQVQLEPDPQTVPVPAPLGLFGLGLLGLAAFRRRG